MREAVHFHSTLRTRILLFTGGVLLVLLLLISQVLLFQWREVIITKQYDSAVAVAKTFVVTVLDALIEEEQSDSIREGVLQTYVDDFMRSLGNVKYVAVQDPQAQMLAAEPALAVEAVQPRTPARITNEVTRVRLYNDSRFAWVIEIREPLRIAGKSWGTATIGFDATPIRRQVRVLFALLFVTTLVISCATLAVLYLLASRLTASLRHLVKEIDSIAIDQKTALPATRAPDDIAFLFNRFDMMKRRIDQSRAQIESAQRQVYQAEKLASIGRLASGVAHQVNNPLNGIRSCLFAMSREPENLEQTRQYLGLIEEEIGNIETVVQKLLGFARPQSPSASPIDISASVQKVTNLFDLRLKEKNIRLVLNLPEGLPLVAIDHHLFQEVVMNLLLNSYDAVGPGGEITITTGRHGDASVFLAVKDNGMGIPAENLKKVFEPFFSTKAIGTGTGLGLSVCQSIVESHNGRIQVQSAEGRGTEFTVILQASETK